MRHLIVMVGLAWPLLATAQTRSATRIPVESGDSMRVIMRSGLQLLGELVAQTGDSVGLRVATTGRISDTVVALGDISFVEARVGRHTAGSTVKGLGFGLVVGAAVGAVGAGVSMANCRRGDDCGMAVLLVPIAAVAGGGVGLLVGAVRTSDKWEAVWPPDAARP